MTDATKRSDRKAYYGDGTQPWDLMKSITVPPGTTLAEAFAQGCVIKYAARYREKASSHSLESAQWYLDRLQEFERKRHEKSLD